MAIGFGVFLAAAGGSAAGSGALQATGRPHPDLADRRFEAEGTLTWFFGNQFPEHAGQVDRTTSFKVRVDGCRWLITVYSPNLSASGGKQVGSDGVDTYITRIVEPQDLSPSPDEDTNSLSSKARMARLKAGLQAGRIAQLAEVRPGALPPFDIGDSHRIWLAFASSCYLHLHPTSRFPLSFLTLPPYPKNGALPVRWTVRWKWHETDPYLLEAFDRLNEGYFYGGAGKWYKYPAPFDQGFTNVHYQVTETRKVGGFLAPWRFTIAMTVPPTSPEGRILTNRFTLVTNRFAIGELTSARPLRGKETGRPKLDRLFEVRDYRAKPAFGLDVVTYRTRSRWLQTNETDFAKAVAGKYDEELLEPRPKLFWQGALTLLS